MTWSPTPPDRIRSLYYNDFGGANPFSGLDEGPNQQIGASMKPMDYGGIFPRWHFSNTPQSHISAAAPQGWGRWPGLTGMAQGGATGGAGPQNGGTYGSGNPFGGSQGTPGGGGGGTPVSGLLGAQVGAPTPMSNPATDGFSHPAAGPNGTTGWQAIVQKMYGGDDPVAAIQKAMGTVTTQLGFGGPGGGPSTMTQANLGNLNNMRAAMQAQGMDAYTAAKIAEAFGSKGQGALDAANALGLGSRYTQMGGLLAPQVTKGK